MRRKSRCWSHPASGWPCRRSICASWQGWLSPHATGAVGRTHAPVEQLCRAATLFAAGVQTQPRFTPNEEEMAAIVRICRSARGCPWRWNWPRRRCANSHALAGCRAERGGDDIGGESARSAATPPLIRAVFEHSWRSLSPVEQETFCAISVFHGGFLAEAAQEVAHSTPLLLTALIDKSLLRRSETGRYDMHELVRQFAHEQLVASGAFFQRPTQPIPDLSKNCLKTAEVRFGGGYQEPSVWIARVEQEIDNLRAVLHWLIAHRPDEGLEMTLNLFWLWQSSKIYPGRVRLVCLCAFAH